MAAAWEAAAAWLGRGRRGSTGAEADCPRPAPLNLLLLVSSEDGTGRPAPPPVMAGEGRNLPAAAAPLPAAEGVVEDVRARVAEMPVAGVPSSAARRRVEVEATRAVLPPPPPGRLRGRPLPAVIPVFALLRASLMRLPLRMALLGWLVIAATAVAAPPPPLTDATAAAPVIRPLLLKLPFRALEGGGFGPVGATGKRAGGLVASGPALGIVEAVG